MANREGYYECRVPFANGTGKLLRYDALVLSEVEEILDIPSALHHMHVDPEDPNAEEKALSRFGFRSLSVFVYAGIKGAGGTMTLEEVSRGIDLTRMDEIIKEIIRAFNVALTGSPEGPKKEAGEAGEKEAGEKQDPLTGAGTG
jgi:hypothetical protein